MSQPFIVKVKTKFEVKTQTIKPVVSWMKMDMPYAVLDIYKYLKTDKETGSQTFYTYFLIGDQDTGIFYWVDSHGVDFVSV